MQILFAGFPITPYYRDFLNRIQSQGGVHVVNVRSAGDQKHVGAGVNLVDSKIEFRDVQLPDSWIPPRRFMQLMFSANGIRANHFKDFATLRMALDEIGQKTSAKVLALAIGDRPQTEMLGSVELRFIEFLDCPETMALYYNASDVYVHAARVDTFPNSVLEAMACGVPVVASAVGGIPEQVISLSGFGWPGGVSGDEATGVLVPSGKPGLLTAAVMTLFDDEVLRSSLSRNARTVACKQFDVARQADQYIELYCRVLKHSNPTIDSAAVP